MLVSIRGEALRLNRDLMEYVHRGLMFSLGRFSERIRRVNVTIANVKDPRGGDDKRCRICVDIGVLGRVVVEDTDARAPAAVDNAAERAARAVKRKIDHAMDRKKRAPGIVYAGTSSGVPSIGKKGSSRQAGGGRLE